MEDFRGHDKPRCGFLPARLITFYKALVPKRMFFCPGIIHTTSILQDFVLSAASKHTGGINQRGGASIAPRWRFAVLHGCYLYRYVASTDPRPQTRPEDCKCGEVTFAQIKNMNQVCLFFLLWSAPWSHINKLFHSTNRIFTFVHLCLFSSWTTL